MLDAPHMDDVMVSLRDWIRSCDLPQYQIAEMAGLHENTLIGIGRDDWSAKIETVRKLCDLRDRLTAGEQRAA